MVGLLYDVHGNLPALDAVLADAVRAGVGSFVVGGDVALFGAWPAETVRRLRSLDASWLRGNGERWTARPSEAPGDPVVQGAVAAARGALGDALVDELASLPATLECEDVLYCHGSPVSDVRSFAPDPAADEAELLAGVTQRRLVFGHTHLPFRRLSATGAVELVNPGSVGMPFDGDARAAYALLDPGGGVEHRRVAYDHAASAAQVRALGGEWTGTVARRIELALF